MIEGQIVIVVDTGNYSSKYSEEVPFKAKIESITDYPCYWVVSTETGKEYELYENQILEGIEVIKMKKLINLENYGL